MTRSLLWLVLAVLPAFSVPIQNDPSFNNAISSIGSSDKLVLMIYTADSCPECAYMKQKVFNDKVIEPLLQANFVIIEKNVQRDDLPDGFDYFGIPTMFFIDKAGHKIAKLVGSSRPAAFAEELHRIRALK